MEVDEAAKMMTQSALTGVHNKQHNANSKLDTSKLDTYSKKVERTSVDFCREPVRLLKENSP